MPAGFLAKELGKKSPYGFAAWLVFRASQQRMQSRQTAQAREGVVPARSERRRLLDRTLGIGEGTTGPGYGPQLDYSYYPLSAANNAWAGLLSKSNASFYLIDVIISGNKKSFCVVFSGTGGGNFDSSYVKMTIHKRGEHISGGIVAFAKLIHLIRVRQGRAEPGTFDFAERQSEALRNIDQLMEDTEEMRRRNPLM